MFEEDINEEERRREGRGGFFSSSFSFSYLSSLNIRS
jgi:hypothetical protein